MASCASDWCALSIGVVFSLYAPALKRSAPPQTASRSWRAPASPVVVRENSSGVTKHSWRKEKRLVVHRVFTPATRTPAVVAAGASVVSLVVTIARRLVSPTESRLLLSASAPVSTSRAPARRRIDGEILVLEWPPRQAPEGSVHDARPPRRVPRAVLVEDVPRVSRRVLEMHRGLLRQAPPWTRARSRRKVPP